MALPPFRFSEAGITRVTRRRKNVVYEVLHDFPLPAKEEAVISEEHIILGYLSSNQVEARLINHKDPIYQRRNMNL